MALPRRSALALLVGAGMAAVAAGSLVLFSLSAQRGALLPPATAPVRPEAPGTEPREAVTVPAFGSPVTTSAAARLITTTEVLDSVPLEVQQVASSQRRSRSVVDLDIELPVRFPARHVSVAVSRDSETWDECPSASDPTRAPSDHPHGGPPACGNPHGGPPGYEGADRKSSKGGEADSPEGSPASPTDEKAATKDEDSQEQPSSDSEEGSTDPSGHPHGGPPGQAEDASSDSDESNGGHPHGAPPGQTKAKKKD